MLKKLSAREKTLIFILFILLLSMGTIYFLINPILTAHTTLKDELTLVQINKKMAENNIKELNNLKDKLSKQQDNKDNLEFFLSPTLDDEEISFMLEDASGDYSVIPKELIIAPLASLPLELEGQEEFCVFKTVEYSFVGDETQAANMLNNVFDRQYVQISKFSTYEEDFELIHTITFNLYMQNS